MRIMILLLLAGLLISVPGISAEKKSKEQILKEVNERLKAEEEKKKKFKIQVINDKEVQFLDDNRQVRKRISLETKIDKVTVKEKIGNTEESYEVDRLTLKNIKLSANGKFAALFTNVADRYKGDEAGNVSGKIALMNENGNTIWEKQLPDKREVGWEPLVADSGEIVVAEGLLMDGSNEDIPSNMFFVFDKKGKEILRVPAMEEQKSVGLIRIEKLSPNGKYLAATFALGINPPYTQFTRFYNLTNLKSFDMDREYVVYSLTDEGISRVRANTKDSKVTEIDLKNYIGD